MFKFLISVFIYIRQIGFFLLNLAYLYHTFNQYAVTKNTIKYTKNVQYIKCSLQIMGTVLFYE